MKPSQQSNWYRFHIGALGLLLISSMPLIAQKPAVTSGSVTDSYTFATTVGVAGVVVDTHGNILFSDTDTDDLDLLAPGSSTPTVLASGFTYGGNKNLRLDSAGNLYVISAYSMPPVLEVVPYANGAYNFANAVDLLAAFHAAAMPVDGGYMQPSDVAISPTGLVYVGSFSNSATGSNPCAGADCIFSIQRDGTNPQIALGPLYNYMPAVSLALDQYGNLSFADTTGIYTINVSDLSTPPTTPITTDISSGLSVDTAGNLLVSDGQTSTQTLRVIPLQAGVPNGAAEYIATGNFYSNASVGVYPVSNASLSGDGGYSNPGNIRTQWVGGSTFGAQGVGVGNTAGLGMTFNFNNSGTFANILTISEGTSTGAGVGEFNYGSGYTMCTAGTTYGSTPSNHTCTLYTNFDPAGVGTRSGSIILTDSSGNVLANHHLMGIGLGALTGIDGGSSNTVIASTTSIGAAKLSSPSAVAVDGVGNVYVADSANARIVELVSGASTPVVFTTGTVTLTDPKGIAVDGAGDVYIADGTGNKVVEVDITGKATTLLASTASIAGKTPSGLNAIAVDGLGNVFVSDTGNDRILRIGQYSVAGVTVSSTTTFGGTALKSPVGIAVDGNDNLYIADTGNNRIVEFNQFGSAAVSAADGKTYSSPTGVAVDPAGDLYVADASGVTVVYTNGHELSAIPTGLSTPYGVALDTLGDIFVANTGDSNIVELNTSSPTLNLGSEAVGSTTTAVSLLLYNIGNQALTFSAAPALDAGDKAFTISSNTCTNGATVATGAVCMIGVTFNPTVSGAVTGSITLTDNAGSGTQTISLSGTGTSVGVSGQNHTSFAHLQVPIASSWRLPLHPDCQASKPPFCRVLVQYTRFRCIILSARASLGTASMPAPAKPLSIRPSVAKHDSLLCMV